MRKPFAVVPFILAFCAGAEPAFAHGGAIPVTPSDVWLRWNYDPFVIVPLLLAHWFYGRGLFQAWERGGRGRIISVWQAASFALGEFVLFVALVSPLDPLGETLLSAHMIQHILLTAVAPPLLLFGAPAIAFTWGIPADARKAISGSQSARRVVRVVDFLSRPLLAASVHWIVLWAWHAPVPFEAAIHNEAIHSLEHLTFLVTALFVWRNAVLVRHPARATSGAGAIFLTFLQGGLLGGLLSLAAEPLYPHYLGYTELWGLTVLDDQQLAGLVMWVPMGAIYLGAFLTLMWSVIFARSGTAAGTRAS